MEQHSYPSKSYCSKNLLQNRIKQLLIAFSAFAMILLSNEAKSQVTILPECINDVPLLYVDLSNAPDSTYISPELVRTGECCGGLGTARFISFYATLHPNAAMVEIGVAEGADPYGSGSYHFVDGGDLFTPGTCVAPIPAGQPVCIPPGITGPDYKIAFSKPGNNKNKFFFRQILKPTFPQDDSTRIGCSLPLDIYGLENIVINAIASSDANPTPSIYNSLLDMSDPSHPVFSPGAGTPQWIDYEICGSQEASTTCGIYATCDVVRLYTFPRLTVNVTPNPAAFCAGGSVDITANSAGGFGPHTYSWSDGTTPGISTTQTLTVSTEDTYEVSVFDDLISPTCPAATYTIPVSEGQVPIANAGVNQKVCADDPATILVGSVTNATGGTWSGGSGTYSPSEDSLITEYTPSAAEITAGYVTLTLTTTGNAASCTAGSDNVTIYFSDVVSASPTYAPLICNGDITTINSNAAGGTAPLTYLWSNGSTAAMINASAGTYTVTVTDSVGCTAVEPVTVIEPSPIVLTTTTTDESVDGACDGGVSVSASGGSGSFVYDWDNDGTGDFDDPASISGTLCYGIYTVVVEDALGCQSSISAVVNKPSCSSFSVSATNSDLNCYGDSDASATAVATGGTAGYSYSWNTTPVQNIATATGLSAGTYTVTATDAGGCVDVSNITVLQPTAITNTMTWTDATSIGGTEGTATANPLGGDPGYSYTWSPAPAAPQITQTVTGLSEGTYYVDITDQNSCVRQDSVHINQPPCNDFYIYVNTKNISCNGLTNGAAFLNIAGGTDPYIISWSTGGSGTSITGLSAGTYSVTVTDNSNCTTFTTFDITEPAPLSISLLPTNVTCFGLGNGTIDLTVTGGVFGYSFDWTQGATSVGENEDLINLGPGTYSVNVIDANGCNIEGSAAITQPQRIVSVPVPTPVTCNGADDGSVSISSTGGTAPYSYSWTGPSGYTGSGNLVGPLEPGQYFVTTVDASGCSRTVDTYVIEPDVLDTTASYLDSVTCLGDSDGSIDLDVAGGTQPYSYSWTGPAGFTSTDTLISGLIEGDYTYTITDDRSCTTTGTITVATVVDITNPVITCTVSDPSVSSDNGTCTYTVSGAGWDATATDNCLVNTITYSMSGATSGTGTSLNGVVFNLGATTVTWTATDNSGNTDICSYVVTVEDNELPIFTACLGSTQNVSSDNGVCTYTVSGTGWDATATDNCTLTSLTYQLTGATTGSGTTLDGVSFNLGTTTVTWTATDAAGNISICTFNVDVSDDEVPAIVNCSPGSNQTVNTDAGVCTYSHSGTAWDATATDNCSVGTITYNLTGATIGSGTSLSGVVFNIGTTTVNWSATDNAGNSSTCSFTVTVLDVELPQITCIADIESCNPIVTFPIATATDNCGLAGITQIAGLPSGSSFPIGTSTVTFQAMDASGNTNTCSFDVIIHPIPVLTLVPTDISCNGLTDGSIDLNVSNSTAPYTYNWSNGATSEDISGLSEGIYNVTVIDTYGCTNSNSASISEPDTLDVVSVVSNTSCYASGDGSVDITVSGGIAPYNFNWSNGSTSQNIVALSPGGYSVDVTDANGCLYTYTTEITEPDLIQFQYLITNATCDAANGTINVQTTGGTTPYTFSWSNGSTTQNLTNAVAGMYTLTLTDNNGCVASLTDSIGSTSNISANFYPNDVSCYGESNGSALAVVQTGNAPYSYAWSNGDSSDFADSLSAGNYSVTIIDAFGCAVTVDFVIDQPDSLYVELASTDIVPGFQVSPFGNDNGSISSVVTGGVPEYEYSWAMGSTDANLYNLTAGTYYLTVTDANRCKASAQITLLEPSDLEIPEGVSPNGDLENDYFVVRGLEAYPDNDLTIYNRWGNVVYETEGYQNDWEGQNNRDEALPDGTYYVVLNVYNGDKRITLTGYIDLRRTR